MTTIILMGVLTAATASAALDLGFSGLRRLFDGSGREPAAADAAVETPKSSLERTIPPAGPAVDVTARIPVPEPDLPRFPRGFFFGAATAAHQVEGDNRDSDWWEFERRRAERDHTDVSVRADDGWHRWREDFALA